MFAMLRPRLRFVSSEDFEMRILPLAVLGMGLALSAAVQARDPQCPALLTDGECGQLTASMALSGQQPGEYSRRIVEFARLMTERYQTCGCDEWLVKWADRVNDSFNQQVR